MIVIITQDLILRLIHKLMRFRVKVTIMETLISIVNGLRKEKRSLRITYEPLMQLVGNENKNDVSIHGDDVIHETTQRESIRKRENANVYVNQYPERDVLLLKNRNQRNEHKGTVVILSDSIAKGINTTKFNKQLNNDTCQPLRNDYHNGR